jgi:hypothetical protein
MKALSFVILINLLSPVVCNSADSDNLIDHSTTLAQPTLGTRMRHFFHELLEKKDYTAFAYHNDSQFWQEGTKWARQSEFNKEFLELKPQGFNLRNNEKHTVEVKIYAKKGEDFQKFAVKLKPNQEIEMRGMDKYFGIRISGTKSSFLNFSDSSSTDGIYDISIDRIKKNIPHREKHDHNHDGMPFDYYNHGHHHHHAQSASKIEEILSSDMIAKLFADPYDTAEGHFGYAKGFLEPFYNGILGMTVEKARENRAANFRNIKEFIESGKLKRTRGDYHIYTRTNLWMTSDKEIPEDRLTSYLDSVRQLKGMTNTLLTNNLGAIPETIRKIQESGLNIKVKSVYDKDVWSKIRGKALIERLLADGRWVAATDVLRFNFEFYTDFGITFNVDDIRPYMDSIDFMALQEKDLLTSGFMIARRGSKLVNKILDHLDHMDAIPEHLRDIGDGIKSPAWVSLCMLTAMADKYISGSDRMLPVPYGSLVNVNSMASWLTKIKTTNEFGETVEEVKVDRGPISKETYFGITDIFHKDGYRSNEEGYYKRFTEPFAKELYGLEPGDLTEKRRQITEKSKEVYFNPLTDTLNRIPHVHHGSWLTDEDNPTEVPDDKLQAFIDSCNILNTGASDWKHMVYVMSKRKVPNAVKILEQANIEVHEISEILPHMKGRKIFDAFIADKRFTNANDIFRMNLAKFGGLYHDLSIRLERDLTSVLAKYHRAFFLRPWGNADHNFFAIPKDDSIFQEILERIDDLSSFPKNLKELMPDAATQLTITGSHLLMATVDAKTDIDNEPTLFLGDGISNPFFTNKPSNSWQGVGAFGNKPIQHSSVNIWEIK